MTGGDSLVATPRGCRSRSRYVAGYQAGGDSSVERFHRHAPRIRRLPPDFAWHNRASAAVARNVAGGAVSCWSARGGARARRPTAAGAGCCPWPAPGTRGRRSRRRTSNDGVAGVARAQHEHEGVGLLRGQRPKLVERGDRHRAAAGVVADPGVGSVGLADVGERGLVGGERGVGHQVGRPLAVGDVVGRLVRPHQVEQADAGHDHGDGGQRPPRPGALARPAQLAGQQLQQVPPADGGGEHGPVVPVLVAGRGLAEDHGVERRPTPAPWRPAVAPAGRAAPPGSRPARRPTAPAG